MVRLIFRKRKTAEEIVKEAGCNIDSAKVRISYLDSDTILLEVDTDNASEIKKLKDYFSRLDYRYDDELVKLIEEKIKRREGIEEARE